MLEQINAMLVDLIGPLGPMIVIGGVGLLLVFATLPAMMDRKPDPLDKLRAAAGPSLHKGKSAKQGQLRVRDGSEKLDKFAHFLEPKTQEELSAARMKLLRAGYRGKNSVRMYHATQFVLGMALLVLGLIYTLATNNGAEPDPLRLVTTALLPGIVGYYLPNYWVTRRVQTRQDEMVAGFPDALDMMLVCVEAGQSLDQSIIRVAKEIKLGYPALGEEFEIVSYEVKAGKERAQVLRDFGERAGIPDINSFVTTMIQASQFGTSVAEALRIYASEMRDKRVMRAEEKANVLPTKITLGTMLFTVPPLLVALIGPSVYVFASGGIGGG
jgi:tight adherence protein C